VDRFLLILSWMAGLLLGGIVIGAGLDVGGVLGVLLISFGFFTVLEVGKSQERNKA